MLQLVDEIPSEPTRAGIPSTADQTILAPIGYLKEGKHVRVIGTAAGGNWYQVQPDSGQMGSVVGSLLEAANGKGSLEPGTPSLKGGSTEAPENSFADITDSRFQKPPRSTRAMQSPRSQAEPSVGAPR